MYCCNCKKYYNDTSKYCLYCGKELVNALQVVKTFIENSDESETNVSEKISEMYNISIEQFNKEIAEVKHTFLKENSLDKVILEGKFKRLTPDFEKFSEDQLIKMIKRNKINTIELGEGYSCSGEKLQRIVFYYRFDTYHEDRWDETGKDVLIFRLIADNDIKWGIDSFFYDYDNEVLLLDTWKGWYLCYLPKREINGLIKIITLRNYLAKNALLKELNSIMLTNDEKKRLCTTYKGMSRLIHCDTNTPDDMFDLTYDQSWYWDELNNFENLLSDESFDNAVVEYIEDPRHEGAFHEFILGDLDYLDIVYNRFDSSVEIQTSEILEMLNSALVDLYKNERYLFEKHVNERTLAFKFGTYLYNEMIKNGLKNYDLDNEYNNDIESSNSLKNIPSGKQYIEPDFIIHQRGNNENNLCVIEIKKKSNESKDNKWDKTKLSELTNLSLNYKYKLGIHLYLTDTIEKCSFDVYENGIKTETRKISVKESAEEERRKMSPSLRYDVMKRDDFRCVLCGRSAEDGVSLEVDHIIPVSKGGLTELDNLQTLCFECNRGKSNK